jgi:hypothetical protein
MTKAQAAVERELIRARADEACRRIRAEMAAVCHDPFCGNPHRHLRSSGKCRPKPPAPVRLFLGDVVDVLTPEGWESGYTLSEARETGKGLRYRCSKGAWVSVMVPVESVRRAPQAVAVC